MNPNTGELRRLLADEAPPDGFQIVPRGFYERIARAELDAAKAAGQEPARIDLNSAHPLARWAAKARAAKKRKAKIAAASRRRNRHGKR